MIESLKHLAYRLPVRYQQDLKRLWFGNKLRRRTLVTDEPEFARLPEWLGEGDWALDVGANIGHYTVRMSELVGRGGRVLAFEPVPRTFELLAANVALLPLTNVSLFNVAASDGCRDVGMRIPHFDGGPLNYYEAKITTEDAHLRVLSVRLDSLGLREPIKLVKIDAEGHELSVLQGMTSIIERDRPRIIAEGAHEGVEALLREFGYRSENAPRSPNRVYQIA
jgi:FkbM family methyltransferase